MMPQRLVDAPARAFIRSCASARVRYALEMIDQLGHCPAG